MRKRLEEGKRIEEGRKRWRKRKDNGEGVGRTKKEDGVKEKDIRGRRKRRKMEREWGDGEKEEHRGREERMEKHKKG